MIEVTNLVKRYGAHTALDKISFEAKPGEIVGLLGPNGAGKTTTMRILTGFMPPSEGSVKIGGYDVIEDSMEVRQRVGYMPERVPIYPDMTVRGYVTFWAKLRGMRHPTKEVDRVLERFSLMDRQNMLVRHLSKGLKQRLGLAQALVHSPEVVILDEPTIGIDPQQVIEARDAVRALKDKHTVLFSSHILTEVEQVCDRVIIINKGKILAQGTTALLSKTVKPGVHLYVLARGTGVTKNEIRAMLEKLPQVEAVQPQGEGFIVSAPQNTDIQAHVSEMIAMHKLTLQEIRPIEISLEDIFLKLVGKG
jgi:ABC-2 type transport system ATP-binding protein